MLVYISMYKELCIYVKSLYKVYIHLYTFTNVCLYCIFCILYLFQMLIKADLIKINYSGVESILGFGQSVHLISSLLEKMKLESHNYHLYTGQYG